MSHPTTNILITPLNWGLGHATRCIPIIRELEKNGFIPIIASDGMALDLLRKEFPHLLALEMPSYNIQYPKDGAYLRWKMIQNSPKMIWAIYQEKQIISRWITQYDIRGIISDNRLGAFSKKTPSVFITHQLNVLSGNTTWLTSLLHQNIIQKYRECWVPDVEGTPNLSGKLGHLKKPIHNVRYIGPLSRMQKNTVEKKYDLMVILSGPEPQRSILENQLKKEILKYKGKVIFIKGILEREQKKEIAEHVTYYNFMHSGELQQAFNESEMILCRSGYTTIMDLAHLEKKSFFIPTPGQYEQEYLARKLKKEGLVPYAKQNDFRIRDLLKADLYRGLQNFNNTPDWEKLFNIFR
ncbi:glycosyltransferase [Flavobacterium sp. GT3R68]|uniref:glycosyltransferase n=1 Tax=Flavobacterium sp. GT3R68 TaxID=2594437 RepID=UPI000F873FBB|nr:glycosyltransferase [Flavobacterium sp. GT3R68]RTY91354.1 glycosyltransferase [Flavobacterium sp. GSN2]TRW93980.1 glycosyltransferase [Flavobacterium sp. GT3R68]